jgi:hypothetical protein
VVVVKLQKKEFIMTNQKTNTNVIIIHNSLVPITYDIKEVEKIIKDIKNAPICNFSE